MSGTTTDPGRTQTSTESPAGTSAGAAPARPEKSLLHHIGVAVSLVLLLAVVALALAAIIVPKVAGATPYTVLTSSMEPHYPPGTLVIIRPVPVDQVQVGDVVTYQLSSGDPTVVTHRVVEKGFRQDGGIQLVTQGDANPVPDQEPVREVQVRGRLWYALPYLGWVNSWLGGGRRQALVPIAAGLFIAYGAWMMLSGVRDRRRRRS